MRLWLAIVLFVAVVDNSHSQDCQDDKGNTVSPNSIMTDDRCITEICRNGNWELVKDNIIPECVLCRVFNDPHFVTFNGIQFDWHIGCNHVLVQEGALQGTFSPTFGVFMDFERLAGTIATVGPTTYMEDSMTTVKLTPGSILVLVNEHPNHITSSKPTVLVKSSGAATTVKAWRNGDCIKLYGKHKILVELCSWQITIYATRGQDKLEGLCGSTGETALAAKKLVGRNGVPHDHPTPGWLQLCDSNFGFSWQTHTTQQSKTDCPAKYNANLGGHGRRKRGIKDQIEDVVQFCGNVTNSPDREQCLNVVTEVDPEMFFNTCMFDLCVAVKFPEINITYDEMLEQVRQVNVEAQAQADQTIDLAAATEAPTTPLPTSPTTHLSTPSPSDETPVVDPSTVTLPPIADSVNNNQDIIVNVKVDINLP